MIENKKANHDTIFFHKILVRVLWVLLNGHMYKQGIGKIKVQLLYLHDSHRKHLVKIKTQL